jgi:SAM-dependent methyltransferase
MLASQISAAQTYQKYLTDAKLFFEKNAPGMTVKNHYQHNVEPNYWQYMLEDVYRTPGKWKGKLALEYGCGAGRNLLNLLILGGFDRVDGIDISKGNAQNAQTFCESKLGPGRTVALEGDGYTCYPFQDKTYSFVMSHQVFIHIPNREIRLSIFQDIYRILVEGGIFICHFKTMQNAVDYQENFNKFPMNVTLKSGDPVKKDFGEIGFKNVNVVEIANYYDGKPEWYIRGGEIT